MCVGSFCMYYVCVFRKEFFMNGPVEAGIKPLEVGRICVLCVFFFCVLCGVCILKVYIQVKMAC